MTLAHTRAADHASRNLKLDVAGAVDSSASKALALLEAMAGSRAGSFGVTEVASAVGVPKSTAHRLLQTLQEHRFVGKVGSRYRVGSRFFELSEAARWSEFGELREVSSRPLAKLFERANAIAVHLAVLSGRDVVYLDKITSPLGTRLPSRVGGRFPAPCTALGKAILAFSDPRLVSEIVSRPIPRPTPYSVAMRGQFVDQLERTRAAGFAIEREEACFGFICVAAPIMRDGKVIAAVSLAVPTGGTSNASTKRLVADGALAVGTAAEIAALLPICEPADDD